MKEFRCEMCFWCFLFLYNGIHCQELEDSEGGDFLFLSNNDEIAEESHPVGKGKGSSKPDCEEKTLISYLSSLQIINPESVIALATKNKLENKCHNVSRTIEHMEAYLKTCNLEPEQEQYSNLLKGVDALHKKLCNKSPYHKSFMEHKKCYGELQTEVGDSCNGPADWCDSSDSKRVCRAYEEIRDCYYIKANVMCGNKAAEVLKDLVQCIIESIITVNCTVIVTQEEFAKMNQEQRLLLQKQKLGNSLGGSLETGSSASLCVSQPVQPFRLIVVVVLLTKLMDIFIQNKAIYFK